MGGHEGVSVGVLLFILNAGGEADAVLGDEEAFVGREIPVLAAVGEDDGGEFEAFCAVDGEKLDGILEGVWSGTGDVLDPVGEGVQIFVSGGELVEEGFGGWERIPGEVGALGEEDLANSFREGMGWISGGLGVGEGLVVVEIEEGRGEGGDPGEGVAGGVKGLGEIK